ncbi:MAG: hypothetical protein AAF297_05965 [Planctomycetota bacterium]
MSALGLSPAAPHGVDSIEIRFTVGRRALATHDPAISATSKAPLDLVFTVVPARTGWSVRCEVADGDTRRTIGTSESVTWHSDAAANLWHIESDAIRATLELTEANARVLFARSPIPAQLHLAGGRYEVAGVTVA